MASDPAALAVAAEAPSRIESDRQRQLTRRWWSAVLLACAAAAVAGWQHEHPRLMVLALLFAGAMLVWASALLGRLMRAATAAAQPGDRPEYWRDAVALQQLALIETRLDLAPVALWQQQGMQLTALNTAARRLLAPGAARDRDELLARLAQAGAADDGGQSMFSYDSERGVERCMLAIQNLVVHQQPMRLLAMMPIESQLEAETLKAWRQLVHVLTHEIMNSLTPIASLSRTAQDMQGDPEQAQDLALALDAVARRAEALARFVGDYRRVSDWPEPHPEPVDIAALFARLERLVGLEWKQRGGYFHSELEPSSISLMADPGQLEQALLNLIKNAAEATQAVAEPMLHLQARLVRGGHLRIAVRDNGPGVPSGMEQDIFTPFFSARARQGTQSGSGIGLAVVRNLIHGMGGTVRYVKQPTGGACFVLNF